EQARSHMFIQYELDEYHGAPQLPLIQEPVFSTGQIAAMIMFGFLAACLFAWWGKSRAEDHDVHPLIGMFLGFAFGWIGILIIPLFKSGQIFHDRRRSDLPPPPTGGNPIYGQNTSFQPPAQPLQHNPQAQQQPVQQATQQAYPQPPSHTQAAPPPPSEPPSMLVADENGYVECPTCQARSKSNRKSCMSCGTQFPEIYDPSYKQK
ncbi:MAG: hypothetical protein L3J82_06420, partial [Planctomycetes bacterium]|nr:hypothetical protein [Planctomycetota bacterium]